MIDPDAEAATAVWARLTGRVVPVTANQPVAFVPGTNAAGSS